MLCKFLFTATPTDSNAPLGLEFWFNNLLIFNTDCLSASQAIEAEFDDEIEGIEHIVKIILKNKTATHTKIDESGAIIKDSLVSISNIKLDDIDLNQLFLEKSVYIHAFNSEAEPTVNSFYGNMGCNGVVEFRFTTPSYLWLLENM
jgi:hypothetical protein